jgi:hypothetical protein
MKAKELGGLGHVPAAVGQHPLRQKRVNHRAAQSPGCTRYDSHRIRKLPHVHYDGL